MMMEIKDGLLGKIMAAGYLPHHSVAQIINSHKGGGAAVKPAVLLGWPKVGHGNVYKKMFLFHCRRCRIDTCWVIVAAGDCKLLMISILEVLLPLSFVVAIHGLLMHMVPKWLVVVKLLTTADMLQAEASGQNFAVGSKCVEKCQDCRVLWSGPRGNSLYSWDSDIHWNKIAAPSSPL